MRGLQWNNVNQWLRILVLGIWIPMGTSAPSATSASSFALGSPVACHSCWHPTERINWQWQLSGAIDLTVPAHMYDVDLFDVSSGTVRTLHALHRVAICYINAGGWEKWRPDAHRFPRTVIGKPYSGWPREWWLDIRQTTILLPIMRERLDRCKAKRFDGVELDNVDGYGNDTGFPLTAGDQLRFNVLLANEAHKRGLSVALKNDSDQARTLVPYFDWALAEDCFHDHWCEQLTPFVRAGKAVMDAEYHLSPTVFCSRAATLHINAIAKRLELGSYRLICAQR
ncbi:MAG: endo alpha-1,4 polygalactosaminidase [Burkholderiaceae bacterium]